MKVKLKVMTGGSAGREIRVKGPRYSIGRNEDCNLRPHSDMISRLHCTLVLDGSNLTLEDAGSKNGSLVNGERIEGSQALAAGDLIQIGPLKFQVMIDQRVGGTKEEKVETLEGTSELTAEIGSDSGDEDISSWLNEADEIDRARRLADPDTRQFKLDDTDRLELEKAASGEKDDSHAKKGLFARAPKKPKKEPGKLPPGPEHVSDDSTEAATHMLKKLFERR